MDISVVVPLFNETESLPELVAWVDRVMKANDFSYEMVMVDDGSRDGSWEEILRLQKEFPQIRGIRFRRNYGKSPALHVAFQAVEGDVVITMDADMQDSPDEIPGLYAMIVEEGYDLVSGWKRKRYDPILKTIPSKFFNAITRWMSKIPLHDFNCGLKAYKLEVVKSIEVFGEMHRYIPLLAKWAGFAKIGEKVVEHRARKYGTTKFGLNRFVNGFLDLITIFLTQKYLKRPMHFFGTWGALFFIIGGADLLYLIGIKLFTDVGLGQRQPAMVFGATALLMGLILFSTGLMGELMARSSSTRNNYLIAETLEHDNNISGRKEAEISPSAPNKK